ncbi:MAG: ribosome-associated translation inhibitor RaiA [Phycisphaerales bacterium]|nr:ribosome-associated translation inhibitor RaiA [Phycisphaerales bacterium]
MDLHIVARNVDHAAPLRQYAEEKLISATERFRENLLAATVRLEDETGPAKGGVDKVCHIELKLRTGEIRIKEQGEDFYATIDVALDRLRAALSREVSRAKRGIAEG